MSKLKELNYLIENHTTVVYDSLWNIVEFKIDLLYTEMVPATLEYMLMVNTAPLGSVKIIFNDKTFKNYYAFVRRYKKEIKNGNRV